VGTDVVAAASLRLYVTNPSPVAGTAYRVASQTWSERDVDERARRRPDTDLLPRRKAVVGSW
jgi:hypothetical protein